MAILSVDTIEPGMTLQADVRDRSGRLLLPAGSELAEKHLKIFRTWGVTEADIVLTGDATEPETVALLTDIDPQILAEAEQEIDRLFCLNDFQHPMIRELRNICLERRLAHAG